jgi:hypothetical protein
MVKCQHASGGAVPPHGGRDGNTCLLVGVGDDLGGTAESSALFVLCRLDPFVHRGFAGSFVGTNQRQDRPRRISCCVVPVRSADLGPGSYAVFGRAGDSNACVISGVCFARGYVRRTHLAGSHYGVHNIRPEALSSIRVAIPAITSEQIARASSRRATLSTNPCR